MEVCAALTIAFHALWAIWRILQKAGIDQAKFILAEGVLTALSFSTAGTLLKALALQSWPQIGMFAFVFSLRTVLKKVFAYEQQRVLNRNAILSPLSR